MKYPQFVSNIIFSYELECECTLSDDVNWIILFIFFSIMADQVIFELRSQRQQDDVLSNLNQSFFMQLHEKELRYIRLKYGGRKSKQTERQLSKIIIDLVASYTDCIDYYGTTGDAAVVYFQAKIKQVNKYFQFLNNQIVQPSPTALGEVQVRQNKNDLGSISDQTGPELLPEQDRQKGMGKTALTQNLMAYLHTQDINTHIKQNMQKEQKINTKIEQNLKKQDDLLTRRQQNRRRNINKTRAFLSFSQRNLNQSRELSEQISQLIITDMEALEVESEQQLKALALEFQQQILGQKMQE